MKRPANHLLVIFIMVALIATTSCNRPPATATSRPTGTFTASIEPTLTPAGTLTPTAIFTATLPPTATQPPPTLTPTATQPLPTPTLSFPPSRISIISAGGDHTCALTASGGVRCWGANGRGQLGNGTTIHSSTPVDVVGLDSGVVSVAAGGDQTCALTAAGGVKCWGLNESGQLGDGTTNDSSTPVDVAGLDSGVVAISVGGGRTCAVTAAGGVKCWGLIWYGQPRYGDYNFSATPVDVPGLSSGIAAVSNGYNHICALTTAGGVKCWGFNASGQLGDGTAKDGSTTPVDVVGLGNGARAISSGSNYTCALMDSGGMKCWGDNTWGQVGDGTQAEKNQPTDVPGLDRGVVAIAAGSGHTCALTDSGGARCWGSNQDGSLGDGTTNRSPVTVDVVGLGRGVIAVAAGHLHTCALMDSGGARCWGNNEFGQLGDSLPPVCVTPVDVKGLGSGTSALSVGGIDACALTTAGGVKCWGHDFLSDDTTSESSTPVDIAGLGGEVNALSVGSISNICALSASGGVMCLDENHTPVDMAGLESGVKAVLAGSEHACALTGSGGVKCWGQNRYGQLGDGTSDKKSAPVDVTGLDSGVAAVAVGYFHTCALMLSGGAKCWGWNGFGQLGDGTETDRLTPVDVVGLGSEVVALVGGGYHTCALSASGGVKCWGQNEEGQLGNGTHTLKSALTPVDVAETGSGFMAITAGEHHTCALTASGSARCWGNNLYGQLGDGTLADRTAPVDVIGLGSGVTAIDAGLNHTCALTASGGVKCWGNDSIGQVGDGRILWSSLPVDVVGWGGAISTATPQKDGAWDLRSPYADPEAPNWISAAEDGYRLDPGFQVAKIDLMYHWIGIGDEVNEYRQILRREGGFWQGEEQIPADDVQALVQAITNLHPQQHLLGATVWTDDYPYWTIELTSLDGDHVLLYSESNAPFYSPWNVVYNGKIYAQFDGQIATALPAFFDFARGNLRADAWSGEGEDKYLPVDDFASLAQVTYGFSGLMLMSRYFTYQPDPQKGELRGYFTDVPLFKGPAGEDIGPFNDLQKVEIDTAEGQSVACTHTIHAVSHGSIRWDFVCPAGKPGESGTYRYPIRVTFKAGAGQTYTSSGELFGYWQPGTVLSAVPFPEEIGKILESEPAARDLLSDHHFVTTYLLAWADPATGLLSHHWKADVNLLGQAQAGEQLVPYAVVLEIEVKDSKLVHWDLDRSKLQSLLQDALAQAVTRQFLEGVPDPFLYLYYAEASDYPLVREDELAACGGIPAAGPLPSPGETLRAFGFAQAYQIRQGFSTYFMQFLLLGDGIRIYRLTIDSQTPEAAFWISLLPPELQPPEMRLFHWISTYPKGQSISFNWGENASSADKNLIIAMFQDMNVEKEITEYAISIKPVTLGMTPEGRFSLTYCQAP